MKLCTDIKPRRDGKVNVVVGEVVYVFAGEPLTAEVEDEGHVAHLLQLGSYYPENAEDFERAGMTLGAALSVNPNGDDDQDDDDDGDDDQDGDQPLGGAPVEALTPKKAAAPKKAKK